MDPIRKGIVRFVDEASFAVQNACQTFGFLPDGRELVEISETDAGFTVSFSDRTEEGWPGFGLNIPAEAFFSQATGGILTRAAFWTVRSSPKAVLEHLSSNNDGFPGPEQGSERGRTFSLNDQVEIKVGGRGKGVSFLVVKQTREPDSIEDAVRARVSSYKDRWGETRE